MPELGHVFEKLIAASANGEFEEVLRRSPLSTAPPRLHPLNFVAMRISDEKGTSLRLHLWDQRFRFGQESFEIHDHSFDLDSYVVQGSVEQVTYEIEPDDDGDSDVFAVRYSPEGSSMLEPTSRGASLRTVGRTTFEVTDRYQLPHARLHRLNLRSEKAMTLVLTRERGSEPISIGPYGADPVRTSRRMLLDQDGRPLDLTRGSLAEIASAAMAPDRP